MNIFTLLIYIVKLLKACASILFSLAEYEGMNFIPFLVEKFSLSGVLGQKNNLAIVGGGGRRGDAGDVYQCRGAMKATELQWSK